MKSNLGAIPLSSDVLTKANIGLWAFELDEGLPPRMYADEAMLGLLGLKEQIPPEEIYHAWYDNVDKDSYPTVDEAVGKMVSGEHAEVQYPWHYPDGRVITVRCGGVRNFAYTKGVRIEGTHQNVTEVLHYQKEKYTAALDKQREKLESDYRTISGLASGYDVLHLVNLETDEFIPYYIENEGLSDTDMIMADYPDFYSAIEAYANAYCNPDQKESILKYKDKDAIRKALHNKKMHSNRIQLTDMFGNYVWYDFVLIKFDRVQDEAVRVAVGLVNIDDDMRAQIAEKSQLEEAEKSLERYNFLINVAHELRTPLTLIVGPLRRLLRTENMTDKGAQIVSRACNQADKMTTLLNTVLTSNKIEEGAEEAIPEPCNFNDWVASVADEFRDEAENHDMPIVVKLDPSVGVVDIDEHLCKIALSNFLINALRHNEFGSPIEVSTKWSDDRKFVRVSVKDLGSGIGDIDISNLFKRYYRATEEKTGFGIGLSYSKTIINAHHGEIGAYNNKGGDGATFWFELPADYNNRIVLEEEAETAKKEFAKPRKLKEKTVLYVEDNQDLRDYMQVETEDVCGKILTAYNGRNALDILQTTPVDIIISDIMMPEIDGLELCKILKSSPEFKHIPVILLTARADVDSRKKGLEAKADYYLDKPFDMDELIDTLENISSSL